MKVIGDYILENPNNLEFLTEVDREEITKRVKDGLPTSYLASAWRDRDIFVWSIEQFNKNTVLVKSLRRCDRAEAESVNKGECI